MSFVLFWLIGPLFLVGDAALFAWLMTHPQVWPQDDDFVGVPCEREARAARERLETSPN